MGRFTTKLSLFVFTASFAAGFGMLSLGSAEANGQTIADLCIATGTKLPDGDEVAGCVYADSTAPMLDAEVCWDGTTARLKGEGPCPYRQRTYFAKHGEVVDPIDGVVIAYAPLPSACSLVPCLPKDDGSSPQDDGVACCDPNTDDCWMPDQNGDCPIGDITWCEDITPNDDDTVTCHEE
jgi:hypothetical protein